MENRYELFSKFGVRNIANARRKTNAQCKRKQISPPLMYYYAERAGRLKMANSKQTERHIANKKCWWNCKIFATNVLSWCDPRSISTMCHRICRPQRDIKINDTRSATDRDMLFKNRLMKPPCSLAFPISDDDVEYWSWLAIRLQLTMMRALILAKFLKTILRKFLLPMVAAQKVTHLEEQAAVLETKPVLPHDSTSFVSWFQPALVWWKNWKKQVLSDRLKVPNHVRFWWLKNNELERSQAYSKYTKEMRKWVFCHLFSHSLCSK